MYHPRVLLRTEIKGLIEAALEGVPVFDTQISDIMANPVTVIVSSAGESVSRTTAVVNGPNAPLRRVMQTEVILVSVYPGDGPEAMLQADDHARQVELALNAPFDPSHDLVGVEVAQDDGEKTIVQISMLYETTFFDEMERN